VVIYVFVHVADVSIGLGKAVVACLIVIVERPLQMRIHVFVSPLVYLSTLCHSYPRMMRASLFFSAAFS
jgi:hypothetical protein